MPSVLIHTLGCKLNQLESEAVSDVFVRAGFDLCSPSAGIFPELVIINTCTVTSKADQKARRVIRKALRDYPKSTVLVTGCYAQLDTKQIRELEAGNTEKRLFVFRGRQKGLLLDLPRRLCEGGQPRCVIKALCEKSEDQTGEHGGTFHFSPERFSGHTRAFLKIQDGCDNHCTFCRTRLARGPSVSLEARQALERLQLLEENHAEAVLTGVNICQYACTSADASSDVSDGGLPDLLEYLLSGTKKINLRLSSLEPDCVNENLAPILSDPRIRPHFHLSIQSGSEKILERMGRSYNPETIENAVTLLRSVKDDPFLACDIITGFPGETEDEFEKTYELCKKTGFAWIHVFPYSKRPGTPAWSFPRTLREEEISERVRILIDLARRGRRDYVRRWLGRELEVLIEKGNPCRGISENYLKLLVQCNGEKTPRPGTVLRCVLQTDQKIENEDYDAAAIPCIMEQV